MSRKKKELKFHFTDYSWPDRTLCGKQIDGTTGNPLNTEGTVPGSRVCISPDEITCKVCLASFLIGEEETKLI